MSLLSVVSPVYNTGSMLQELVSRISATLTPIDKNFEIIFVDDGSTDFSWEIISSLAHEHPFIRGVKLSRNFGQHAAIAAGLKYTKADWIVVMDSDLQDPPETITALYEETRKGYSIVLARRRLRSDSLYRRFMSRLFYAIFSKLSGIPADHATANFGIYSRKVIEHILAMKELNPFFPMMISWLGFEKIAIEYDHGTRPAGRSGYDFRKLIRLALNTTLSYSNKPLRYVMKLGLLISAASFIYGIIVVIRYFSGRIVVLGYTSLIVSIWLLGGIILFTLGITGLYIGKIFEEVKGRPLYIVEKTLNDSI